MHRAALNLFGAQLEQRSSSTNIRLMMEWAALERVVFQKINPGGVVMDTVI